MLPLVGLLLFGPLLIGSIVAGVAKARWLRYSMTAFSFLPVIVGTLFTFPDVDVLIIWGVFILLHLVIRFIALRLSQGLN